MLHQGLQHKLAIEELRRGREPWRRGILEAVECSAILDLLAWADSAFAEFPDAHRHPREEHVHVPQGTPVGLSECLKWNAQCRFKVQRQLEGGDP